MVVFMILPCVADISENFEGILLDAYGVFWGGSNIGVFSGAQEKLKKFVEQGKTVGILTNTTQLSPKEIQKLHKHGLVEGIHFHFLVTAGDIAKHTFSNDLLPFPTPNKKYWVFGTNHPKFASFYPLFEGSPFTETTNIEEADFIHIAIPHIDGIDQTDPEIFRANTEKLISSGLPMVCANPDHFAHEGNPPRLVVRQGTIATIYENVGGKVVYMGKPGISAYQAAMEQFSLRGIKNKNQIVMVGDTPVTDIKGANEFDISSALLTKTGVTAENIATYGLQKTLDALTTELKPTLLLETL